jgi:hypothetical protein
MAAGCSGGAHEHATTAAHAAPRLHGVYFAWVTVHGQQSRVWLDSESGRYAAWSATPSGHGAPRTKTLWVFDGRSAETVTGKSAFVLAGSRRFVAEAGAPPAVAALRRRVRGAAALPGTSVAITRRLDEAPVGLLTLPKVRLIGRVTEVQPGVRPHGGPEAYWLGPRFRHRRPEWADITVSRSGRSYSVAYAGLNVDSGPPMGLGCDATTTALVDGTLARVVVLQAGDDGTFGCDLSNPPAGSASGEVILMSGSALGSTYVVVTTRTETITLSGPALTPQNAVPLARALRPV